MNNFYMSSKVSLLSPFNYADWNPKMSTYLKRQCLFDVSISVLSELKSYEEKIDSITNCDRDYGVMCLGMSPNIYHLIGSVEYPFELWKNLDKAFGLQEIEDGAWSEPTSPLYLSLKIYWNLHSLMKSIMMNNFLIHFMFLLPSLIRMLPPSTKPANIEEPSFSVSLESDFSSCDTIDEK